MAKTPSKKSAKAPKKESGDKKKKKAKETYSTYIYKVLKQVRASASDRAAGRVTAGATARSVRGKEEAARVASSAKRFARGPKRRFSTSAARPRLVRTVERRSMRVRSQSLAGFARASEKRFARGPKRRRRDRRFEDDSS